MRGEQTATEESAKSYRSFFACASLALCVPILFQFYWPAAGGLDVMGHPLGRDFINVWAGPQLAFSGQLATLFDQQAYHDALMALFGSPMRFHTWSYPPTALPLFLPFAELPYFPSLIVWTVGLFGVYAYVGLRPVSAVNRPAALALLLLAPASLVNIAGGQNGFATAALFMGGLMALDRRPVLAGIAFGLLTVKPQLGIVLPFVLVALGAWRTIAAAIITALVLVLLSLLTVGVEAWAGFLGPLRDNQMIALAQFEGFYTYMMVSAYAAARLSGLPFTAAMTVQALISICVLATAVWAAMRTSATAERAFVLAAAVPLITPYAFNYDLTALSLAIVWKLMGVIPMRRRDPAVLFVGYLTPLAAMYGNMIGLAVAPFALLAVFGLAVRDALAVREAPAAAVTQSAPKYP